MVDAVQGGEVAIVIVHLVAAGEQAALFVQNHRRLDVVVSHPQDSLTIVNDSNSVEPDTRKEVIEAGKEGQMEEAHQEGPLHGRLDLVHKQGVAHRPYKAHRVCYRYPVEPGRTKSEIPSRCVFKKWRSPKPLGHCACNLEPKACREDLWPILLKHDPAEPPADRPLHSRRCH